MRSKKSSNCHLLLLLVFSSFVGEIHGRTKHESDMLSRLYKSKLLNRDSIIDTTLVQENIVEFDYTNYKIESQKGLKEKDRIQKLPGQPQNKVGFSQYGGYVTVDRKSGRAFYYYFAEAEHSKDSLPLLLWLNGGPGCSSLAYGAMQELGPFRVHSDGKTLFRNRYSWNKAANVLFLESPAGVGFSYSNTSSDYGNSGDGRTAEDNYVFIVNWLERFPEYKKREFYISGESYAGHYVPQLAHAILSHNNKANNTIINLKGIIIGNAVINDETDSKGMYDYFANHALISEQSAKEINQHCDFTPDAKTQSKECNSAVDAAEQDVSRLDIYNIYAPLCHSTNLTSLPNKVSIRSFDPCSEYYVYNYVNMPDVQEAMHANITKLTHDWEPCSDVITDWKDSPYTILPLLHEFISSRLRVWIFSGDTDGRVPVTSTQYSMDNMKLPVKKSWHPWFLNAEVGGYSQVYEGDVTFVTVRGAGHQVPSYQPVRALSLIKHFLAGTPLPDTS